MVRDRIPGLAATNGQPGTFHQADPAEIECARARKAGTHGAYTRRIIWHQPTTP